MNIFLEEEFFLEDRRVDPHLWLFQLLFQNPNCCLNNMTKEMSPAQAWVAGSEHPLNEVFPFSSLSEVLETWPSFLLDTNARSHPAVLSTMGCLDRGMKKEQDRKELWQCFLTLLFSFIEAYEDRQPRNPVCEGHCFSFWHFVRERYVTAILGRAHSLWGVQWAC